jgi:hypothetical protein
MASLHLSSGHFFLQINIKLGRFAAQQTKNGLENGASLRGNELP